MKRIGILLLVSMVCLAMLGASGQRDKTEKIEQFHRGGELIIDSDSPAITINTSDRTNDLVVSLTGDGKDQYNFSVRQQRGVVTVEVKRKKTINVNLFSRNNAELTVLIPSSWRDGSLNVSTVSGALDIKKPIEARTISLKSVSGRITFESFTKAQSVALKSVSGAIRGEKIQSDAISLDSVSGSIRVNSLTTDRGEVKISSVSGKISVNTLSSPRTTIKNVSGSTDCTIPRDFSGSVSISSLSGSLSQKLLKGFDVVTEKRRNTYYIGRGSDTLDISSTSGSITVAQ